MFKKKFLPVLIGTFLFSSVVPGISFAAETKNAKVEQQQQQAIDNEMFSQSKTILQAIENIPNSVVEQGPQKTAEWLQNKTGYYVSIDNKENLIFNEIDPAKSKNIQSFSASACIGAVGVALVSNGIPFTKILKVKSALKALGGTANAVSKIKKYYDSYRYNGFSRNDSIKKALNKASSGLAGDTKAALLDFFNLSNVIANCF
ncbi:hypothetical protein [Bacillus sp. FSL R12-0074]|uniref:hypothetical protein n=1 Tax=Bacillus sp. FSL R12-0074 TaxID=2954664 RepID=UPI0030FC600B